MKNLTNRIILPLGFLLLLIGAWELLIYWRQIPKWLIAAPSDIWSAWPQMAPNLLMHSQFTLMTALTGLVIAIGVALFFAILMGFSPLIRQSLYPLLVISQNIPIIAVAPLFIIWFGYGMLPKVIVVALVCFFPMVVSLMQGMDAADEDMVNLLHAMGATSWQIIKEVRFPAALPSFFGGLKIAGTYSMMGAVIGEWLGSSKGLGIFMNRASHSYQLDRVFGAIIVIAMLSYAIFLTIDFISKRAMPWYNKK